jgi:hypothetical protein
MDRSDQPVTELPEILAVSVGNLFVLDNHLQFVVRLDPKAATC